MWENVLLHLCRPTDPPKAAGRATLRLLQLPLLISGTQIKSQMHELAADARKATELPAQPRNRPLAHKELPRRMAVPRRRLPLQAVRTWSTRSPRSAGL